MAYIEMRSAYLSLRRMRVAYEYIQCIIAQISLVGVVRLRTVLI